MSTDLIHSPIQACRRIAFLACLVLALVFEAQHLYGADYAAADNGSRVIPSELCRGLWIVPVTFDDDPHKSLRLILDTGAIPTSVDPDSIERIIDRRVRPGKKVRLRDGEAGPLRIRKIKVISHEMDHLSRVLGTRIDGILGFPVFKDLLLTLDYHDSEVRIAKGSLPAEDNRTIFRDVGKVRPYLAVDLGEDRVPVLIDSGSTSGLTLLGDDPLTWETPPRATSGSVRYDTIEVDHEGRHANDIPFGPLSLSKPVVEVREDGPRIVGHKILKRFELTFDQAQRTIRMRPDSPDPVHLEPVRGIGVVFRPREQGLEVASALDGMPAASAGVQDGDVVIAVDGTPVYERACRPSYEESDAESLILSVRRGDATLDIAVNLDVLVP